MSPSTRTEAGYRLYTEKDIQKLQRILRLKSLGLSLEEIHHSLGEKPEALLQRLSEKRKQLQGQRKVLDTALRLMDAFAEWEGLQASGVSMDWHQIDHLLQNQQQQMSIISTHGTLTDALKVARQQLVRDERIQYLSLLDEETVQSAIQTAMVAYPISERNQRYISDVIAPLLKKIIEVGEWPQNAEFGIHYSVTEEIEGRESVTYTGLGFGIEIETPHEEFAGFSLPVLEAWYGRWV